MTIDKKIIDIIIERAGVDREDITVDSHLVDDLGLDSLDIVDIVMGAEEEFDIEIEDDGKPQASTVQQIINLVKERINA